MQSILVEDSCSSFALKNHRLLEFVKFLFWNSWIRSIVSVWGGSLSFVQQIKHLFYWNKPFPAALMHQVRGAHSADRAALNGVWWRTSVQERASDRNRRRWSFNPESCRGEGRHWKPPHSAQNSSSSELRYCCFFLTFQCKHSARLSNQSFTGSRKQMEGTGKQEVVMVILGKIKETSSGVFCNSNRADDVKQSDEILGFSLNNGSWF